MSDGEIATQPAVGVRRARGGWKKIALPAPLGAPRKILVKHEGQIIEMIVAPHPVGAIGGGQAHGAIVTRARRVLAPALVAAHGLERHARGVRSRAVRSVIAPQEPEPPGRRPRSPSRLILTIPAARARREAERPRRQPAARPISCERPDAEEGEARGHVHAESAAIRMRDMRGAPQPQPGLRRADSRAIFAALADLIARVRHPPHSRASMGVSRCSKRDRRLADHGPSCRQRTENRG